MGEACTIYSWDEAKKILYQSERPTGITVMCADFNTKNQFVYSTLEKTFGTMISVTSGSCSVGRVRRALKSSGAVCVSLTPTDAGNHAKRHDIVTTLRNAGVRKVYGVYLRVENAESQDVKTAIAALEADPPTVDGLDGLIIL